MLAGGAKVRVLGIDAPEMERDGQPAHFLAHKAKADVAGLTLGKTVALEYDRLRYDHYGRLLAYLFLPDRTLVNAGWCARAWPGSTSIAPNVRYQKALLTPPSRRPWRPGGASGKNRWRNRDEPYLPGEPAIPCACTAPSCPLAAKMAPANRVRFTSLKEAYLQGYSPCRSCKP